MHHCSVSHSIALARPPVAPCSDLCARFGRLAGNPSPCTSTAPQRQAAPADKMAADEVVSSVLEGMEEAVRGMSGGRALRSVAEASP